VPPLRRGAAVPAPGVGAWAAPPDEASSSARVILDRPGGAQNGLRGGLTEFAPSLALKQIRAGVARALRGNRDACRLTLPKQFALEVKFTTPVDAYRASWYPGAKLSAPRTVQFESADYFEILRAIKFIA